MLHGLGFPLLPLLRPLSSLLFCCFLQLFPIIAGRDFKSTLIAILPSSILSPPLSSTLPPPPRLSFPLLCFYRPRNGFKTLARKKITWGQELIFHSLFSSQRSFCFPSASGKGDGGRTSDKIEKNYGRRPSKAVAWWGEHGRRAGGSNGGWMINCNRRTLTEW